MNKLKEIKSLFETMVSSYKFQLDTTTKCEVQLFNFEYLNNYQVKAVCNYPLGFKNFILRNNFELTHNLYILLSIFNGDLKYIDIKHAKSFDFSIYENMQDTEKFKVKKELIEWII